MHVLHQTPEGAPVFTPGEAVAEEMSELKAGDGEKVSAYSRGKGKVERGRGDWGGKSGKGDGVEERS